VPFLLKDSVMFAERISSSKSRRDLFIVYHFADSITRGEAFDMLCHAISKTYAFRIIDIEILYKI